MANKKGTALMMVWADIPADKEEDFNRWYNEEHLQELLSVPGILNAARYEAVRSGPKHLACYEIESPAVIETDAFKNRLCRTVFRGNQQADFGTQGLHDLNVPAGVAEIYGGDGNPSHTVNILYLICPGLPSKLAAGCGSYSTMPGLLAMV